LGEYFEPKTDFFRIVEHSVRHHFRRNGGSGSLDQRRIIRALPKVRDLENDADEHKLELERKLVESFITPLIVKTFMIFRSSWMK